MPSITPRQDPDIGLDGAALGSPRRHITRRLAGGLSAERTPGVYLALLTARMAMIGFRGGARPPRIPPPSTTKEVGVSSRENPSSPAWTYRMEVSPTGQGPTPSVPNANDPSSCSICWSTSRPRRSMHRQMLEVQRQQLELSREMVQVTREQRARQGAELERWQTGHERRPRPCRETLGRLEQVHAVADGRAGQLRRGEPREPARRRFLADRLRRPLRPPPGPPQHDARRPPPPGRRPKPEG